MVSRRVFYLPELITFFVQNHQVTLVITPGDAERPLRHLWLRAWLNIKRKIFESSQWPHLLNTSVFQLQDDILYIL